MPTCGAHQRAPKLLQVNSKTNRVRLVVPVSVPRARNLPEAIEQAARVADVIELRLDALSDDAQLDEAVRDLHQLRRTAGKRLLLLTLRPATQGGGREMSDERRDAFWSQVFATCRDDFDYADLELDLVERYQRANVEAHAPSESSIDWSRVICSHHDFNGVSLNLTQIYGRMTRTSAATLKLAVRADDATDALVLWQLLERARRDGRALIAIAMGETGAFTRVLAHAHGGAPFTYAALDKAHANAPGQLSADELRKLYRVASLKAQTEITGLLGWPVAHSLSPRMHNRAFAAHALDAVYLPFAVRDVRGFLRRMAHPRTRELSWPLRGLSVTAPHKRDVIECLDWIEPAAREIDAVNTILVTKDELHGYNTDGRAALAPLENLLELGGARVAVIGAGGAARAVLWSLREAEARATVFARDTAKAEVVATHFGAACQPLEEARFGGFAVVINTTPLGTRGVDEDATPAVAAQLAGVAVAYDLVYNPRVTRFLREAQAAGCVHTPNGLGMLVAQAAAQFNLWTGQAAPVELMREAAANSDE